MTATPNHDTAGDALRELPRMKAITLILAGAVSSVSAAPDVPVREVTRLAGVQQLSIAPDGVLQLVSLPHQPSWVPSLRHRAPNGVTFLANAKLRVGESVFAADMRRVRITYTLVAVTSIDALFVVHEERSFLGFGDIDERSDYRVRVRSYTCTPEEIDAIVRPKPVTEPIFATRQ